MEDKNNQQSQEGINDEENDNEKSETDRERKEPPKNKTNRKE